MSDTATTERISIIDSIAREAFETLGNGRQIESFSARHPGFTLADAYQVTSRVHALRIARGEKPLGRKIGFTNRTIWPEYNVYAPIWGYVYDTTVHDLTRTQTLPLAGMAEPRIEPEIVFGLRAAPSPDMDERALLACIEWVAHGFEIVQSIFPRWKFTPADTVAAYGLHGALLIGPRKAVGADAEEWLRSLSTFEVGLSVDDRAADHGHAANVLDGPLSALRHVVGLLAADKVNPPLAAGEIVTTGTLTRALPISAGETWATALRGIALDGISLRFS